MVYQNLFKKYVGNKPKSQLNFGVGVFNFFTMKRILLLSLLIFVTSFTFGQDCPEPKEKNYNKVMSPAFAEEFENCPVTIEAEYLKEGYLKNYRKPKKLKKMYFFQCTSVDGDTKPAAGTNEPSGDFFVIDKSLADLVLDLKKGDKIKVTGTTFTQNHFGIELSTFFKVSNVEKVE